MHPLGNIGPLPWQPKRAAADDRRPSLLVRVLPVFAVWVTLVASVTAQPRELPGRGAASQQKLGAISGTVLFQGDVPHARVRDDTGERRAVLQVDRKTRGLRYAVAYLVTESSPATRTPEVPADEKPVVIDQLEHTFVPHLVAIRSGQTVKFTNSDTANHNVRASSLQARNEFNIFTGAGGDYRQQFFADRNRPVRLGCDIHPWMRAWVYPFDHPYFAVTDARGRFNIGKIPPGTYTLFVRQPDGGLSHKQAVAVEVGQPLRVKIEFKAEQVKGL